MTNDDLDDDYDELDALDEALQDCGLDGSNGQCGLAGSEWCDFECPMRDSEYFAGSAAWVRARSKP